LELFGVPIGTGAFAILHGNPAQHARLFQPHFQPRGLIVVEHTQNGMFLEEMDDQMDDEMDSVPLRNLVF